MRMTLLGAILCSSCAAPLQRATTTAPSPARGGPAPSAAVSTAQPPRVGVAFGGGSARGIAHVGVIRWLEEHRIPIDVAAGTSMGGLVGGAFATGMDAAELQAFINSIDWDELFGASSFEYKNIRRKADARAYPSRLEFGLKGGRIVPPTALNNGQSVELMLARITAPYFDIEDFDELPTPFRTVAVDLLSAEPVVMRSGSLADALRATMSLPLAFPPVDVDGRMLVDGGAMNNVPADVVRAMGAGRVVAVNVGDLSNREGVDASMFGLASETMDAMMRASTRRALMSADVVVNVPLKEYGSLDWRRAAGSDRGRLPSRRGDARSTAAAGRDGIRVRGLAGRPAGQAPHRHAAAHLRPARWLRAERCEAAGGAARPARRRAGGRRRRRAGHRRDGRPRPLPVGHLAADERYRARRRPARARPCQAVRSSVPDARRLTLENTTSNDFRLSASARYLAFDPVGSGSELRIDGTIGSDASLAAELYRPIGVDPAVRCAICRCGHDDVRSHRRGCGHRAVSADHPAARTERRRQSSVRAAICAWARTSGAARRQSKPGIPAFRS